VDVTDQIGPDGYSTEDESTKAAEERSHDNLGRVSRDWRIESQQLQSLLRFRLVRQIRGFLSLSKKKIGPDISAPMLGSSDFQEGQDV